MSRRFGRQQKRKMRAEIVAAEKAAAYLEFSLREQKMLSRRNAQIVSDTARILGRHFVSLPPETIAKTALSNPRFRMMIKPDPSPMEFLGNEQAFTEIALHTVDIHELKGELHVDNLRSYVHCQFKYQGEQVAYGISDMAFRSTPKDFLVRNISEAMAWQLCKLFRIEQPTPSEGRE